MSRMADQLDGLVAATGLAHDLVPLFLQGLLEVEADDGLVLGDHDTGGQERSFRSSLMQDSR